MMGIAFAVLIYLLVRMGAGEWVFYMLYGALIWSLL